MRRGIVACFVVLLAGCAQHELIPGPWARPTATPAPPAILAASPDAVTASTTPLMPWQTPGEPDASATPTPAPSPSEAALPRAGRWQIVSLKGQAKASSGPAENVIDGDGQTEWNPRTPIAPGAPQWLAMPLKEAAKGRLAVLWHGHALHFEDYNYGQPRSYELQASSDSTDGSDGTWQTVGSVKDNPVRSRADIVSAPGARWLRLSFTDSWGGTTENEPFLRELAVYEEESPGAPDVWAIFGDSTTAVGFDPSEPMNFGQAVDGLHPGYAAMPIPAGTGGDMSSDAAKRLTVGLPTLPAGSVIGLCYGTNDMKVSMPIESFKANLKAAIAQVRAAGDVPVLAVVPWNLNGQIEAYAQACRDVAASEHTPPGPDFYTYFKAHQDELQVDRVHPNEAGAAAMQRLWAASGSFRYP